MGDPVLAQMAPWVVASQAIQPGVEMKVVVLAALATLAACAGPDRIPRPAEGYRALRVLEPLRVPFGFGYWELGAGLTLVGDSAVNGETLFCGTAPHREIAVTLAHTCASFQSGTLIMNAEKAVRNAPFTVPIGAIEEFRLR